MSQKVLKRAFQGSSGALKDFQGLLRFVGSALPGSRGPLKAPQETLIKAPGEPYPSFVRNSFWKPWEPFFGKVTESVREFSGNFLAELIFRWLGGLPGPSANHFQLVSNQKMV